MDIGKSINFIRHVCQDQRDIMSRDERILQSAGQMTGECQTGTVQSGANPGLS